MYRSGKLRPFGPFHLKLSEYFLGLALSSLFGLGWMISYFQPLRSQKRAASSGVWNSSVMCVLESGSFVDVQPISGFDQRFV